MLVILYETGFGRLLTSIVAPVGGTIALPIQLHGGRSFNGLIS